MSDSFYKEQYRRANNHRATAFIDRPFIGSPGAPAQAETNASMIWGHMLGGFLFGYEYTRWWKEFEGLADHCNHRRLELAAQSVDQRT